MKYHEIGSMTWSYSRLKAYEDCPYRFFLQYIESCDQKRLFFSDFGSFMHGILADFYLKKLSADELVPHYLEHFRSEVVGEAPSSNVFLSFFNEGFEYIRKVAKPSAEILAVERRVQFEISGYPFVGFVDLIVLNSDRNIEIWDHKSHPLRPRSNRQAATKSDKELDEYLRQLYLYSIPVCEMFSAQQTSLVFNCYRKGVVIREPFRADRLEEAKQWALSVINQIKSDQSFRPHPDYFRCRYLCDVSDHCEYRGEN